MSEYKKRLLAWTPDATGYSRIDTILAIGYQCYDKRFKIDEVISWLGKPDKADGNYDSGYFVYEFEKGSESTPLFTIERGEVCCFVTVASFKPNAEKTDPKTGQTVQFNILDEMNEFREEDFRNK